MGRFKSLQGGCKRGRYRGVSQQKKNLEKIKKERSQTVGRKTDDQVL